MAVKYYWQSNTADTILAIFSHSSGILLALVAEKYLQ
jgi:hypothetical protein